MAASNLSKFSFSSPLNKILGNKFLRLGPRATLVSAVEGNSIMAFLALEPFVPSTFVLTVRYSEVPAVLSTTFLFSSSKLTAQADMDSTTPVCEPVKLLDKPLLIKSNGTISPS